MENNMQGFRKYINKSIKKKLLAGIISITIKYVDDVMTTSDISNYICIFILFEI